MRRLKTLLRYLFPAIPSAIADDFNLLRAKRVQRQSSWLSAALLLTVPVTIYAASDGASFWVRIVLPVFIGVLFLTALISSQRQYGGDIDAAKAKKFIQDTTRSTPLIAALCSAWCVTSWMGAPEQSKVYYPMILAMGSLTTVYCLSSIRAAAILNLVIGLMPITAMMMFSGNRLDFATSISLLMASSFLLHMIFAQHDQWIYLLSLKREMQVLANTDPLTGLLNRRALDNHIRNGIESADAKDGFTIALLDLDGFKSVNDIHGHAVGDELLRQVAVRLRKVAGEQAVVARQGGDEFAIFLPNDAMAKQNIIADKILTELIRPCQIEGHRIRVGASVGIAHWPKDGRDRKTLFEIADRALYAAKAMTKQNAGCSDNISRTAA